MEHLAVKTPLTLLDIGIFLQRHLAGHLATVVAHTPGLFEEIMHAVIMKSYAHPLIDVMSIKDPLPYRFVRVAKLLTRCIPKSRPLTADELRAAVKELPSGIEDSHAMVLTCIREREPHLARLGMDALSWVYFSKRSKRRMTVKELQHALSFQQSNTISKDDLISEDRIRSACAGLIDFVALKNKQATAGCQFSREFHIRMLRPDYD